QPACADVQLVFPHRLTNLGLLSRNQRLEFENTLRRCSIEKNSPGKESEHLADALFVVCLALLLRYVKDVEELASARSQMSACARAVEYIKRHYNRPITLNDLARVAGLHPQYFSHKFTVEMGMSPMVALTQERIGAAKNLLDYTGLSISEIGLRIGYQDV